MGIPRGIGQAPKKGTRRPTILGLALAALAHGLFNFFTVSPKLRLGAALLVLIIWIWQIRNLEKRANADKT